MQGGLPCPSAEVAIRVSAHHQSQTYQVCYALTPK